jgi:hypothetical protein
MNTSPYGPLLCRVIGISVGAVVGGPLAAAVGDQVGKLGYELIGDVLGGQEKLSENIGDFVGNITAGLIPFLKVLPDQPDFNHSFRRGLAQALIDVLQNKILVTFCEQSPDSLSSQQQVKAKKIFDTLAKHVRLREKKSANQNDMELFDSLFPECTPDSAIADLQDPVRNELKESSLLLDKWYEQVLLPIIKGKHDDDIPITHKDVLSFVRKPDSLQEMVNDLGGPELFKQRFLIALSIQFPPAFGQMLKKKGNEEIRIGTARLIMNEVRATVKALPEKIEGLDEKLDRIIQSFEDNAVLDQYTVAALDKILLALKTLHEKIDKQSEQLGTIIENTKIKPGSYEDNLHLYKYSLYNHFKDHDNVGLKAKGNADEKYDVPILLRDLFVMPNCTEKPISPDELDTALRIGNNPTKPLLKLLEKHERLVILGDPGIGKSTFIQWIIINLTQRDATPDTPPSLAGYVPLPFYVRDLSKLLMEPPERWNWSYLVTAFLNYKLAKGDASPLATPFLNSHTGDIQFYEDLLKRDKIIFLFDGLDEIGNHERRVALRKAIWQGFEQISNSNDKARWILTSRIIGYESAPVDVEEIKRQPSDQPQGNPRPNVYPIPRVHRLFLAPFDDDQQNEYAMNWYSKRLPESKGPVRAKDFLKAVRRHQSTRVIGRVPNLLHLLALLFLHQAKLPDGRFKVYEAISESYLQSIDLSKGLDGEDKTLIHVSVSDKENWLMAIAWKMQLRHVAGRGEGQSETDIQSGILATRQEIEDWGLSSLPYHEATNQKFVFDVFLDYIMRRSGLLIPRGNNQYGFAHLSFLEFYAARALELERSRLTLDPDDIGLGLKREDFESFACNPLFHEVLTFLAEGAHNKPTAKNVMTMLFPPAFSNDVTPEDLPRFLPFSSARLMANFSINPHVSLDDDTRRTIWDKLWQAWLSWPYSPNYHDKDKRWNIAPALLERADYQTRVLQSLVSHFGDRENLSLYNCTGLTDILPLQDLKSLRSLSLLKCIVLQNIKPIERLTNLEVLDLEGCISINDLEPLKDLNNLQRLYLGGCINVENLKSLGYLTQLKQLSLQGCHKITNLKPLMNLRNLEYLTISGCAGLKGDHSDIGALQAKLPYLEVKH